MIPLIPILCLLAIGGGTGGYLWYSGLSQREQDEANLLAAEYARQVYYKTLDQLSAEEARHVYTLTSKHFTT